MTDKIRVGGMTIDAQSDIEYSSRQVRWLVEVAFENGKRAGQEETIKEIARFIAKKNWSRRENDE